MKKKTKERKGFLSSYSTKERWLRLRRGMGRYGMRWEFLTFSQLGWDFNDKRIDFISCEWKTYSSHFIRMKNDIDTISFFREIPFASYEMSTDES